LKKLTVQKAAERLEMSSDFVRDQMEKKRIAYFKIGGRYFIAEDDLEEFIRRSRVAAFGERPLKRKEASA
jgi:excisionase family DNA binding protein